MKPSPIFSGNVHQSHSDGKPVIELYSNLEFVVHPVGLPPVSVYLSSSQALSLAESLIKATNHALKRRAEIAEIAEIAEFARKESAK